MEKKGMELELKRIRGEESQIKAEEDLILKRLNLELQKEKLQNLKRLEKLKHFTFGDFAQVVIGVIAFSLPPMLSPDLWGYMENVTTLMLIGVHLLVVACFIIALNYEFRDNFNWNPRFYKRLFKRVFYVYTSTIIIVFVLLVMIHQLTFETPNIDALRNCLTGMSIGLVGAVTFSFLKK